MALETAYEECAALVRAHDRDRYLASLFAPAEVRPNLQALYAFDIETARIPAIVSEPMIGEIRLQWWRDALGGVAHGDLSAAPVLAALQDTLYRFGLGPDQLIALTEARIFDLYDDRMPDIDTLEGYAGETAGTILQMAATMLAGSAVAGAADVSGHGGVASVICRGLSALVASGLRDGRLVPTALGDDHGAVIDASRSEPAENCDAVWAALCKTALSHAQQAQRALKSCDDVIDAAYLHLCLTFRDLKRLQTRGPVVGTASPGSALARQWHLWRAVRSGGLRGTKL
ncbi:MAG: squalene/phytoene synthase family protein [Pseudomonadota bacterium]